MHTQPPDQNPPKGGRVPTFSVVVPAYNAALFIADCVQSVLAQTDADFELIVVDDGSTDATASLVRDYCADPRVHLVQRVNGGLAAARNTGVQAARGEWVAFLDADDRWCPEKLAAHRQILSQDPSISVSYDCSVFIDSEGARTGLQMAQTKQPLTHAALLLKNWLGNGSTSVVKRSVLQEVGGFDEHLPRMVDQELWVRLSFQDHRFQQVPGVLTEYRSHPNSFTADTRRMLQGLEIFLQRVSLYAPESVRQLRPLILACTHRWMARAAFMAGNYGEARHHAVLALQSTPSVLWRDPRAPITLVAILMQTILPTPVFRVIRQWGLEGAARWFARRRSSQVPHHVS